VQHQLLACSEQPAPERASDAYVEHVFDGFAATFDTKLASLGYCAPQLLTDALAKVLPAAAAQFAIADVGCGTGQCGPMAKAWASRLVGCDLSGAMIEKAQLRDVYDEFHKQELSAFLRDRPDAFDVVLSCDTLIYFGELQGAISAAGMSLRAGGWLAFTLEALPDDDDADHRLTRSGRYAHSLAYIRTVLASAGLEELAIGREVVRTEASQPVNGWIVTARRAG
jgi:predicted TPR repeat methyltransferase